MSQTKQAVSEEWARSHAESGARSRAAAATAQGADPREALTPDWKRVFKAQTTAENTLRQVNRAPSSTQAASDAAFSALGKRRAVRNALDAVVADYPGAPSAPQVFDARRPAAAHTPGGRWQLPLALAATAGLAGTGAYALSQNKSAAYLAGRAVAYARLR